MIVMSFYNLIKHLTLVSAVIAINTKRSTENVLYSIIPIPTSHIFKDRTKIKKAWLENSDQSNILYRDCILRLYIIIFEFNLIYWMVVYTNLMFIQKSLLLRKIFASLFQNFRIYQILHYSFISLYSFKSIILFF